MQRIELQIDGQTIEVAAYPHPDKHSISLSLDGPSGNVWRALIDTRDGRAEASGISDNARLVAALGNELTAMRWRYAGPALIIGAALGFTIGKVFA